MKAGWRGIGRRIRMALMSGRLRRLDIIRDSELADGYWELTMEGSKGGVREEKRGMWLKPKKEVVEGGKEARSWEKSIGRRRRKSKEKEERSRRKD
jgi:hypothetical protein